MKILKKINLVLFGFLLTILTGCTSYIPDTVVYTEVPTTYIVYEHPRYYKTYRSKYYYNYRYKDYRIKPRHHVITKNKRR